MALMLDVFTRLDSAKVTIDQGRCLRVRNRNSSCRKCADACVSGCIEYADNQLSIAPEKCIGCATCASACPTDALIPKDPTDAALYSRCIETGRKNGGRVVIVCQDMLNAADGLYDPSSVSAVPCLGRVDCSLLVRLVADGANAVVLVRGGCGGCENSHAAMTYESTVASANVLLEAWSSPVSVALSAKLPSYTRAKRDLSYDQSRRSFFSLVGNEAKEAAVAAADCAVEDFLGKREEVQGGLAHVDDNGTLPHSVSSRRRMLLEALDELGERYGDVSDGLMDVSLWREAMINVDSCNSCRMCATFCPTGANFKFKTKDGRIGVKHQVRKCAGCGLCAEICPTHSLELSEEVFPSDISENVIERFLLKGSDRTMLHESMQEAMRGHMKDKNVFVNLA